MHVQHFTLPTAHRHGPVIDQMLKLRHRVFVQGSAWQIPQWEQREADQFDCALWTNYFVLFDDDGQVRATGRNIRCDHPYMLKELWPELAYGAPLPEGPDWSEGSRMCVDPSASKEESNIFHAVITLAAMEWAVGQGIQRFCFVTYPWAIKALKHMGLEPVAFGKPMAFGHEEFLAGYYPVDAESCAAVRERTGITGPVLRLDEEAVAA